MLLLIAHIGGHCVAFDTATIESVVDIDTVVPVPRVDPTVRGLAALRSRVVTVIDAGAALGLPDSATPLRRAVVAAVGDHPYAFTVDTLEDVADFTLRTLTPGMVMTGAWARAAIGYVERGDEAVLVIDLAALIPNASMRTDRSAA